MARTLVFTPYESSVPVRHWLDFLCTMPDGPGVDRILFYFISWIKIEFYSDVKDLLGVSRG